MCARACVRVCVRARTRRHNVSVEQRVGCKMKLYPISTILLFYSRLPYRFLFQQPKKKKKIFFNCILPRVPVLLVPPCLQRRCPSHFSFLSELRALIGKTFSEIVYLNATFFVRSLRSVFFNQNSSHAKKERSGSIRMIFSV